MAVLGVLEFGQFVAAPFCTRLLGDPGADVVKVEPPGAGDPVRQWGARFKGESAWLSVHGRNKRCVTLNLKKPHAGIGLANVHAAHREGVRVFEKASGGLGGCSFAPGATGNVATEDVAWMFGRMGATTGVYLGALLPVAQEAAELPGA